LFILGLAVAHPVSAEGDPLVFIDVFGGYSWSENQDADSRLSVNGDPNGRASLKDLDVYNGPAFGGRIGAWLNSHPNIGLAFDATHFDTDIDRQNAQLVVSPDPGGVSRTLATQDIRVSNTLVSLDLIVRHRGESAFTPYVMAGPGLMFANMEAGGFFGNGSNQSDNDLGFGFKAGVGISYKISDTMHLFTEYRYIYGSPEYNLERSTDPVTGAATNEDLEIDSATHFAVGGLSIRF
jgi:opacity protein-like surface antigen